MPAAARPSSTAKNKEQSHIDGQTINAVTPAANAIKEGKYHEHDNQRINRYEERYRKGDNLREPHIGYHEAERRGHLHQAGIGNAIIRQLVKVPGRTGNHTTGGRQTSQGNDERHQQVARGAKEDAYSPRH